jgi:ADP-L-glycero-D-manno-heptose 6-epimerase
MIIVTGAAGFIGSNITHRLAGRGDVDIVVCDWLGEASLGKWRNIADADIADLIAPEALEAFLERHWRSIEAVVHMGAVSSTTEADIDLVASTNFGLSKTLWDWAAARQRPLIYASSAATYGDGAHGFVDANDRAAVRALKPLNAYGWSKKLFDLYALRQMERGQAPPRWAGLRFFNVYGPREQHKGAQQSVVAHIYPKASKGEAVRLFKSHRPDYADGGQLRDFVHVGDCVDVVEWLLVGARQGGLLNVGAGAARSFAELAKAVFAACGAKPKIEYIDTPEEIRANYQYFTQADLTRLRTLGFEKQMTPLEAGVTDYVTRCLAPGAR